MISLYHESAYASSKKVTELYSTSFSLGIKALSKEVRQPIYAIYGLVRYADEIVDTFHEYDKETLLKEFQHDTHLAIGRGISLNPVLHAFQLVANEYRIDRELIDAFFNSMAYDLNNDRCDAHQYNEYIYGSAEVVGLMCLKVFCNGDQAQYEQLKPSARRLGAAFQKVNFLRDMKSDFEERGRVYFPGLDFEHFNERSKAAIVKDIEADFEAGLEGILALPKSAKSGVYLAYNYYYKLFKKIKRASIREVIAERIRIPNQQKLYILANTMLKGYFGVI